MCTPATRPANRLWRGVIRPIYKDARLSPYATAVAASTVSTATTSRGATEAAAAAALVEGRWEGEGDELAVGDAAPLHVRLELQRVRRGA